MMWLHNGKKFDYIFSRVDTITACDGRTDKHIHLATGYSLRMHSIAW